MKTMNISDDLHKQLKIRSIHLGKPMATVAQDILEDGLRRGANR